MEVLLITLVLSAAMLGTLWFLNRASKKKFKFIIIKQYKREVRAKVLSEDENSYKAVTMDDDDGGAVEIRIRKNDKRIIKIYTE